MSFLPFDDRDGVIWFDGALVPWRDAKIHVLTHGLHYSSCVFEGERVYNGKPFKLTEHSRRLAKSAEHLGFQLPYSIDEIDAATRETVDASGFKAAYVRPVAWRGAEEMGVSAHSNRIHVAIAVWNDWASYFDPAAKMRGVHLSWGTWKRPPPDCLPSAAKAAGVYMIGTLAHHQAEREGFHDALLLDWRGRVAEATGANVFFVIDGAIHTPVPDCFLDGITRQTVIELARKKGYQVFVRPIFPEEIGRASEVFLTGTAAEITPVGRISDHVHTPGKVCEDLIAGFSELTKG